MSERKKQIWLRPDQVDVVTECLTYAKDRAEDVNNLNKSIDLLAKRVLVRRINEVLALLTAEK